MVRQVTDEVYKAIENLIEVFVEQSRSELAQRLTKWQTDLSQAEVHEVIGAHLARQHTLARELAQNPRIWHQHIAPMILRAMADVYISVAWILDDPVDRARKFVLHGLGQAKLRLEHRKEAMNGREPAPDENAAIQALEDWIDHQRFTFLTEVNVGSWSGISTRQMAEEAGCIDFYNLVYNPFSACTHSMWHHVAVYNLKVCSNPLHRYHRIPHDPALPLDPHYVYLAGKYWQKTLSSFDRKVALQVDPPSAFNRLCGDLAKLDEFATDEDDAPGARGDTQPARSPGQPRSIDVGE